MNHPDYPGLYAYIPLSTLTFLSFGQYFGLSELVVQLGPNLN